MGTNVSVHKVTRFEVLITEPRNDIMGRRYRVAKLKITTADGQDVEMDFFGDGFALEDINPDANGQTMAQVYPFVELERPNVDG